VDEFGLGFRRPPEADVGPAGLKGLAVTRRAHLQPLLAAGCPQLEVVFLRGGETQIPGHHLDHPERNFEGPADVAGIFDDALERQV